MGFVGVLVVFRKKFNLERGSIMLGYETPMLGYETLPRIGEGALIVIGLLCASIVVVFIAVSILGWILDWIQRNKD